MITDKVLTKILSAKIDKLQQELELEKAKTIHLRGMNYKAQCQQVEAKPMRYATLGFELCGPVEACSVESKGDAMQQAYKMGFKAGVESIKKPVEPTAEWIPALVKYQEVPKWWRIPEIKAKLMGEVILVKALTQEERFIQEDRYGAGHLTHRSDRNTEGGKWYWTASDLILYPKKEDIELTQKRIHLSKGYAK